MLLRLDGAHDARPAPAPRHETAAALAMLAAPLLGYAVAVLGTGAFVHRYFLIATLGVSILVPHLLAYLESYRKHMLLALGGVLLLFLSARDLSSARLLLRAGPDLSLVYPSLLSNSNGSLPLVITHGHVFAVVLHYAPPALVSRAVYLFNPRSLQIGVETRYLQGLSRWNDDLQMERIDTFLRDNRRFLFYGPTPAVFLDEVSRRGGRAVLRAVDIDRSMFAVSRPGSCSLFEVSLP